MHETHLFQNLVKYLDEEERTSDKKICKIHINLSKFGGLSEEHFLSHFSEIANDTKWKDLKIDFTSIPYGPELEITELEYA
jgi:Zn finger protein HypA/HybF involved in hydrogenase expression